jgi:hypothetical protein
MATATFTMKVICVKRNGEVQGGYEYVFQPSANQPNIKQGSFYFIATIKDMFLLGSEYEVPITYETE